MGLPKPALRFLAREHKRRPFAEPVLLLGRQCVYATLEEAREIVRSEGLEPAETPASAAGRPPFPGWDAPPYSGFTTDAAFFGLLGLRDVKALDVSDFEGAELLADLNMPVGAELQGRFKLVVDSGTLEHVFDLRQSFSNVARLLAPGGRAVHITPANNYMNHGFVQMSPTLFYDYYGTNGFEDLRGWVAVEKKGTWRHEFKPWDVYELPPGGPEKQMSHDRMMAVLFSAEKTPQSTADKVPLQSYYRNLHSPGSAAAPEPGGLKGFLKKNLPPPAKRAAIWIRDTFVRPWQDETAAPWGLKKKERLG
jgi:hypothetical protein